MPFALLVIGIMLVTVAVRNTQDTFIKLVKGDFSGQGNFFYWVIALVVIGAIGSVEKLKPLADALLLVILAALILTSGNPARPAGGFFKQFMSALSGLGVAGAGASTIGTYPGTTLPRGGQIGITVPPIMVQI